MFTTRKLAAGLVLAASSASAQKEVPDASDLRRRGLGDIAVLGDYLYYEGGEVSQYILGEEDTVGSRTLNVTLSVSLKESWTNETMPFAEIDRGDKPLVKDNSLWADNATNRLYQWDGQGPYFGKDGASNPKMWSFEPDGSGKGEWSTTQPSNPSAYNNILRHAGAASAVCGGKAYSIGGFGTAASDDQLDNGSEIPVPGMIIVELETREWSNRSLADMAPPYGSLVRGKATCISGFGDDDYVMVIGGKSTRPDNTGTGEGVSMGNLTFWDTKNEKWLWQETSGSTPAARWDHCIAGQPSKNGTYELFMYGGRNNVEDDLDDVWVLTLPGFHWERVDVDSPRRYFQSCVSVGNRQILSAGGYSRAGWADDDPWINGIGVFDLSTLAWSSQYDADDDDYEPAKLVRDWYMDDNLDRVSWSSDDVKAIFSSSPSLSLPSDKDNNRSSGNDNNDGDGDGQGDEGSSTPVGAIAGGVVGGVGAIAIIGAALFFWRRRARKQKSAELSSEPVQPDYQQVAGSDQSPSQGPSPAPMSQGYYAPNAHPQQYQQYYEYKPGDAQAQQYSAELPVNQNSLASELDGTDSRPSELHGGSAIAPAQR